MTADGRKKGVLRVAIGLLFGALFAGLVIKDLEWSKVDDIIRASDYSYLPAILLLMGGHYLVKGLRWRALLSSRLSVSSWLAVRLTNVTFLFNNLFPARAGELARPWLLTRHHPDVPFSFALATALGDKIFDLLFGVSALVFSMMLLPVPPSVKIAVWAITAITLTGLAGGWAVVWWHNQELDRPESHRPVLRFFSRRGRWGSKVYHFVLDFAAGIATLSSFRRFLKATFWLLVSSGMLIVAALLTLRMFDLEGNIIHCLFIWGMTGLGLAIPSAPTNAGSFHFFATEAVLLLGLASQEVAFSFALISHLSQVMVITVLGLLSLPGLKLRQSWK